MKNNKGFSLVELIIVVTIISILAAAIAPVLYHYIDDSRKADDVAAAESIGTALKASMSNEDIYDNIMNTLSGTPSIDGYACTALLVASNNDTEWTIYDASSSADLTKLKEEMDRTCPPEKLKFRKLIDPSEEGDSNDNYLVGGENDFEPDGWLVCLNSTNEPCVYVTNGKKDATIQGVSLNPLRCSDYK